MSQWLEFNNGFVLVGLLKGPTYSIDHQRLQVHERIGLGAESDVDMGPRKVIGCGVPNGELDVPRNV